MSDFADAARIVTALPEVVETTKYGNRTWAVGKRSVCWERPFSKADVKRYGAETPPDGPILAIACEDLDEKEALLAAHPDCYFTIPHFNGFAAILVQLSVTPVELLEEAILDGWLAAAPERLAQEFLSR